MVIVINSVIGGLTKQSALNTITANCPIKLSDYKPTQQLVKNKAVNAPIKFEKIVIMVIIHW